MQDVGNSPAEPTITFTRGDFKPKKDRRSSIGRRVSFSAATKVKEFRTDEKDLTVWNATYEEERSTLNSDSSSQKSDDNVFVDKTFVSNDDMEVTAIQTPRVRSLPKEKENEKNQTMSMDLTIAPQVETTSADALSGLIEKFGSKKDKSTTQANDMDLTSAVPKTLIKSPSMDCPNQSSMELTGAVPSIVPTNQNDSMEMTKSISANMKKKMTQFKNESMEMTEAVPSAKAGNEIDMEITEALPNLKANKTSTLTNTSMEMTEAVPPMNFVHKENMPIIHNEAKNVSMEMTEAVPSVEFRENENISFKQDRRDDSMEMTEAVPRMSNTGKENVPLIKQSEELRNVSMEMTEAVPSIEVLDKENLPQQNSEKNISMELTTAVPNMKNITDKENVSYQSDVKNASMEMTEAFPSIRIGGPVKESLRKAEDLKNVSMEMTEAVPRNMSANVNTTSATTEFIPVTALENLGNVSMEITEAVPKIRSKEKLERKSSDLSMNMIETVLTNKTHDEPTYNVSMEITEAVPCMSAAESDSTYKTKDVLEISEGDSMHGKVAVKETSPEKAVKSANFPNKSAKVAAVSVLGNSVDNSDDTDSVPLKTDGKCMEKPSVSRAIEHKSKDVTDSKGRSNRSTIRKKSNTSASKGEPIPQLNEEKTGISLPIEMSVDQKWFTECKEYQTETTDLEKSNETLEIDAYETRSKERRQHTHSLKRFLDDLDQSSSPAEEVPTKKAKISEHLSIFQHLAQRQKERTDYSHWNLLSEKENGATFGFLLDTWQIQLVLGHALPVKATKMTHWAIRKVNLNIVRQKDADPIIHLVDHLISQEWPHERLSAIFKSTETLRESLNTFGNSVNKAADFIMDAREIEGNHSEFKIDPVEMKASIEFYSLKKICSFVIEVNFKSGFKEAKTKGTRFSPGISNGFMIGESAFERIVQYSPSGWSFLKHLVENTDSYLLVCEAQN